MGKGSVESPGLNPTSAWPTTWQAHTAPTCGDECFSHILDLLSSKRREKRQAEARDRYERIILFLGSVPIFRKQLPPAELPILAQNMVETVWRPGQMLCRQGETGNAFYLICSGMASVISVDCRGEPRDHSTLCAGDWLGGHSLHSERTNVATVIAKGPDPLVTVSMSKSRFEETGLREKLIFPKRPALHGENDRSHDMVVHALGSCARPGTRSTPELTRAGGRDFILAALERNANVRAFCRRMDDADAVLEEMACSAEKRDITAGCVIAEQGHLGQDFFVIHKGAVEVFVANRPPGEETQQRSAENAVSSFSTAERIKRKQDFMLQLHKPSAKKTSGCRAASFNTKVRSESEDSPHRWDSASSPSLMGARSFFRARSIVEGFSRSKKGDPLAAFTPAAESAERTITMLRSGESFGELSLLYNTRREATFRAIEDTTVFVISRRVFKHFISRNSGRQRFEEYCSLLNEVYVLTPLLQSERRELASNAGDVIIYKPGARILHQGKERRSLLWYVISKGTAIISQEVNGTTKVLGRYSRSNHFGERSLLRAVDGVCVAEMSVDAGPDGLTCLTFDGELIRELLIGLGGAQDQNCNLHKCLVNGDVEGFCREKELCNGNRFRSKVEPQRLKKICTVGKGAFGRVMYVEDVVEQKRYALKRLSKGHIQREEMTQQLFWERELLSMTDSPFIVGFFGTFKDSQFVFFLLEPVLGGDLNHFVYKTHPDVFASNNPEREKNTAFYVACVIAGLEYLHRRKIVYRDLKLENIMLDTQGYGKIVDMGLARLVPGKSNTRSGTPDYMAPEVIDPPHFHDSSADWWSLGVFTFELLCKQVPFNDEGLEDAGDRLLAIRRSQEQSVHFKFDTPFLAKSFVSDLLQKVPGRLGATKGAEAIRKHKFFSKMPFDFKALHNRTLPSPVAVPWTDPEDIEPGGIADKDAQDAGLFEEYVDDGTGWDKDF